MASLQSTHPFTCNTCQVAFRSGDLQRAHMQTDWHRYNLKRRVASLPPLSSEIFTEKVLANKASAAATAAKASFEKACQACQKTYYSENAYNNHLNSAKHKNNVANANKGHMDDSASVSGSVLSSAMSLGGSTAESDVTHRGRDDADSVSEVAEAVENTKLEDDKDSVASSTKPQLDPLLDCLFCNYRSPNFSLNVNHMSRFHGLFVPEREFLTEPEELIKYLHRKINDRHQCIKCHKVVHTASGIQTHMRDRGHCMIAFEDDVELVEIGQFYDFRSSYPDADEFEAKEQEDDSDGSQSTADGGVKLGAPRKAVIETGEEEDEGWETDSTVSSVPTDEITSVPIDDRSHRYKLLGQSRHHAHGDPRPHRNADGYHSHAHATPVAVYHDDYELHLPSGRTAGHRSMNKYYRQNLRNYPGVAERMEKAQRLLEEGASDSEGEDRADRSQRGRGRELISRADGGQGMIGVSDAKKAEVRAIEKRDRVKAQRAQNNYKAKLEKQHNFQKHFRDPLLQ